jgi:uncharacterized protein
MTASLFENLAEQLDKLRAVNGHKTVAEMAGLFYAIAVTPFRITEMEIVAELFNQHKPEMNATTTETLLKLITEIGQSFQQQFSADSLQMPYSFQNVADAESGAAYQWLNGFYRGLLLREALWRYEDDGVTENKAIMVSFSVFASLSAAGEMNDIDLLAKIPTAIQAVEQFAAKVRAEIAEAQKLLVFAVHNPIRTGRNEPCPCGSGKKYKKCCALNS